MAKNKQKTSIFGAVLLSMLFLALGFCSGFAGYGFLTLLPSDIYVSTDLKIDFFDMGTKNHGDCIYIQIGNIDIIVDGGPQASSVETIYNYIAPKMHDDIIEYAIITHAHEDHIAGFAGTSTSESLFDKFEFETIIDFPLTNQTGVETTTYGRYLSERNSEVQSGATHYNALQCWDSSGGAKQVYSLGASTELQILYNYYYENTTSNENLYSVCFQIKQDEKYFLFTGDLEENGEQKLIENNTLHQVEFYKAGHHGSYTANSSELLSVIQPNICVVPCVAGYNQYNASTENVFPSQTFINNIANYTDKIYIPTYYNDSATNKYSLLNGNIVITSNKNSTTVSCSNNSRLLKDTNWFPTNRTLPSAWQE